MGPIREYTDFGDIVMRVAELPIESASGPRVRRFTREDFYRMSEAGVIPDRNVELLDGEIIEMAPQRDPHALCVVFTDYALRRVFGDGYTIRVQLPFEISGVSQPEPDVVVLAGSPRTHAGHPTTALLVIEVADTSIDYDRKRKAHAYAEAGIQDFWIVNLNRRCVEIHRHPAVHQGNVSHQYTDIQIISPPSTISPLALPDARILVSDLLP